MSFAWFIVRLLAVTVGFAALHGYLWWRLCRDTTKRGSVWRPIGAVILGALAAFGLLARTYAPSDAPMWFQQFVGWPGWTWFGIFMYLFGLLVVAEPLRWYLLRRRSNGSRNRDGGNRTAAARNADRDATTPKDRRTPKPSSNRGKPNSDTPDRGIQSSAERHTPEQSLNRGEPSTDTPGPGVQSPANRHAPEPSLHRGDPGTDTPDLGIQSPPSTATPETEGEAGDTPPGQTRRLLVSRAISLGAATIALATVGHGLYEAYRTPPLKAVTVPLARLPRQFDGYRIAVVGDTHFSAMRGRGYCERVVDQINRAQADLIAFVGDLASNEADQIRHETDPLANLQSRDGTFFVAGNAEHYVGADEWYARVAELGMTGLPNTRIELPGFDLAGVNDLIVEQRNLQDETGPDLEAALGDRDPDRPVILMAHQPSMIDRALDYGIDLQLSGHTHGGQMWPVHYLSRLRSGQLTGLEMHEGTPVYVTNGAGTNGPPIRVGADADITVMTLRAESSQRLS
jgi:predicted MPP superfamily phosphohydrolase